MHRTNLGDYFGGWFIGNFEPTMMKTSAFEVCLKRYAKGDREELHFQIQSVEFSLIVEGRCRIGDIELGPNEILRIEPLEAADFEALTDVVMVAVKVPSIPEDKKLGAANDR